MFGIHGLDAFGFAHAMIGIAAFAFGAIVIAQTKGSACHRLWGSLYVVAMVLLNASALAMYDLNGRFNTFHVLALVSLATLAAGWIPALLRRPARLWYERHAMFMAWSYVGLIAALVSEIATRMPALHFGTMFYATVGVVTFAVVAAGALAIQRLVPRAVRGIQQ